MIQTASRIEFLQLVVACIGLAFALWGIRTAVTDAMTTEPDAPSRILALGYIRSQVTRVAVHSLLVFAGSASINLPPPPPSYDSQQAFIVRGVMVCVTVLLSIDYALDRRVRFLFNNHPLFKSRYPKGTA